MRTKSIMINIFLLTSLLVSSFVITVEADSFDATIIVISPETVDIGNNFDVIINISYVEDFDAANFDVTFNSDIINVTQVTGGKINNTNLPCAWSFIENGRIRLIINLPGLTGISGEGNLAEIQFETITAGTSNINLSNGVLSNSTVQPITAEWINGTVQIKDKEEKPPSPHSPSPPAQPPVSDNVIANASESETFGYIGVPITFDSSESTGDITSYEWDFGDGQIGSGEIVTHTYTVGEIYIVTLTVSGATSSDIETFQVVINSLPNTPPTKPTLTGSDTGNVNVEYLYNALSSDDNNDTLRYVFDWGDGEITTTEFLSEGQQVTQKHIWTSPGIYVLKVTANDNKTDSSTLEHTVAIDAIVVGNIGYLTDDNSDGIYDLFHGENIETNVKKQTEETYLIDTNADDTYDKIFDTVTLDIVGYIQPEDGKEKTAQFPIEYIVIGLVVAIFFGIIIYLLKEKPAKNSETNKPNYDSKERINEIISKHEKKNEEISNQEKINVICPRCKEVLSITKSNPTESIRCSNCGERGIIGDK